MIVASFQIQSQQKKIGFFLKTFLITDINMDIVLKMPFFTIRNINIQFDKVQFIWSSYTISEILLTTK